MRSQLLKGLTSVENRFRLFFIVQYLGVGLFSPYLALYLTAKGLSGFQLGLILGSMPLVTIIAQPLWGLLSDFFHIRRAFLFLACLGVGGISISFYWVENTNLLILAFLLYSALLAPVGLLSTSLALDYLEKKGHVEDFGLLRLWGSVGFAITALVTGSLFLETLIGTLPVIYGGIMVFLAFVALVLPEAPPLERNYWWGSLSQFRGQSSLMLFLVGTLFIGSSLGVGMQYLAVYMEELQASGWIIGFAISLQAILEVPLMFFAPRWVARYGLGFVLLGGVVLLPLRWLLYAVITQPWLVVPTQLLHSMTIVSMMVVGVMYVDQQMPKQWRATGQGLYMTVMNAIGPAIGLFAAGVAYERAGISQVWLLNALVTVLGVIALFVTFLLLIPKKRKSEA